MISALANLGYHHLKMAKHFMKRGATFVRYDPTTGKVVTVRAVHYRNGKRFYRGVNYAVVHHQGLLGHLKKTMYVVHHRPNGTRVKIGFAAIRH